MNNCLTTCIGTRVQVEFVLFPRNSKKNAVCLHVDTILNLPMFRLDQITNGNQKYHFGDELVLTRQIRMTIFKLANFGGQRLDDD